MSEKKTIRVEIDLDGVTRGNAKTMVNAVLMFTKVLCQNMGADPAEGTMMLLTAACEIARVHALARITPERRLEKLAEILGYASVAAEQMFTLDGRDEETKH